MPTLPLQNCLPRSLTRCCASLTPQSNSTSTSWPFPAAPHRATSPPITQCPQASHCLLQHADPAGSYGPPPSATLTALGAASWPVWEPTEQGAETQGNTLSKRKGRSACCSGDTERAGCSTETSGWQSHPHLALRLSSGSPILVAPYKGAPPLAWGRHGTWVSLNS